MAQAHLDRALLNATSTGSDVGAAAASVASTEVTLQQTQGYLARGRTLARAGQISQMAVDHAQTIVDKAVAARSCV